MFLSEVDSICELSVAGRIPKTTEAKMTCDRESRRLCSCLIIHLALAMLFRLSVD